MIYEVSVSKKTISRVTKEDLVRGNVEVDVLKVTFDAEWDGMESIQCVFANGACKVRMDVIDGQCEIPWEVYDETGSVSLAFLGYDNEGEDARIVTRAMLTQNYYSVVDHGIVDGEDGREPSCDTYQNLVKRIEEAEGGAGASLPEGGTEGQMLSLDSEGNAVWAEVPDGLPEGGEVGQVLTKTAEGAAWLDLPSDHVTWDGLLVAFDQCGIAHPTADELGALLTDEDGKLYII